MGQGSGAPAPPPAKSAGLAGRAWSSYTSGVKTALSLPDAVFEEAELLARRTQRSRSQLYAEALAEYVARHAPDAVTEAMDAVLARVHPEPDRFAARAVRKLLQDTAW